MPLLMAARAHIINRHSLSRCPPPPYIYCFYVLSRFSPCRCRCPIHYILYFHTGAENESYFCYGESIRHAIITIFARARSLPPRTYADEREPRAVARHFSAVDADRAGCCLFFLRHGCCHHIGREERGRRGGRAKVPSPVPSKQEARRGEGGDEIMPRAMMLWRRRQQQGNARHTDVCSLPHRQPMRAVSYSEPRVQRNARFSGKYVQARVRLRVAGARHARQKVKASRAQRQ